MPEATSSCMRCLGLIIALAGPLNLANAVQEPKSANRFASSQAQPNEVRGTERRLLARFERSLEHAQDALDIADQILTLDSQAVVAVDKTHYVSLQEYCHRLLSQLPAEALADYRALVDAPAEVWYRQGVANRDERLLQRVLDEAFCSSWGDDALNALGQLSLERGDYLAARMAWMRISASLHNEEGSVGLTYPDADLNLAEVQARLVLVSLREENLVRAESELKRLFQKHADARGWLGGREVVYTAALKQLIEQARSWPPKKEPSNWPTFGGTPARKNSRRLRRPISFQKIWSHQISEQDRDLLSTFPIVTDRLAIYQDASQVQALHLESGEEAFSSQGETFQSPSELSEATQQPIHTLMASDQYVFGSTIKLVGRRQSHEAEGVLWGIDLERDGALAVRKKMEKSAVGFAGAPLVVGSQMFVAIRASDNSARVGIACYDLATSKLRWQQWICQTRGIVPSAVNLGASNLLTYDSGVVFCCTNIGATAALRASDGQVLWLRTYDRTKMLPGDGLARFRLPNPCIYHDSTLFVAPSDSDKLFALKAATGDVQWQQEMVSLTGEIIGVAGDKVFLSDQGLQAVDSRTGEAITLNSNLRLFGQPAITEGLIFWPSNEKIELIETATGAVLEQTVPLAEQGGVNLVLADNYLIATGRTQITAYRVITEPSEKKGARELRE
ncbi:MAG: PQQ-binding-like beta-propeller repeat protein [Planctomycetes bacterium]|nr:PQQ-binding-like beta-propeller repeat protein [Planctomycetota bacterium]